MTDLTADYFNRIMQLERERDRLKAELEACQCPIMTHTEKISYWEQKHKEVLSQLSLAKEALEKINACRGQMAMWNLAEQALQKLGELKA